MYLKSLLLIIILCGYFCGFANQEHRYSERHSYRILNDQNSLIEEISIEGTTDSEDGTVYLHFNELHPLEIQLAEFKEKGKWKKLKQRDFVTSHLPSRTSFFAGNKAVLVPMPANTEFRIQYLREQSDLLLFTSLYLTPYIQTDTLSFEIMVPNAYGFHYRLPEEATMELLGTFNADSTKMEEDMRYVFKLISDKSSNQATTRDELRAFIRVLVSYGDLKDKPSAFFNARYQEYLNTISVDNESLIKDWIADVITPEMSSEEKVAEVFAAVQSDIAYLDLEAGYGAFIPRAPDVTLFKRKGDCKDMSFLMKRAFDHLAIPASLAISSTIHHPVDMNFPSLSSGNHVVCVVQHNSKDIVLDATESLCAFGDPSRQIQGRSLLISNPTSHRYITVPVLNPERNKRLVELDLFVDRTSGLAKGTLKMKLYGHSGFALRRLIRSSTQTNLNESVSALLKRDYPGIEISDLKVNERADEQTADLSASISLPLELTSNGKKGYLTCSFVNTNHIPDWSEPNQELKTFQTIDYEQNIKLKFDSPIAMNSMPRYSTAIGKIKGEINLEHPKPNTLRIAVRYVNGMVEISPDQFEGFQEITQRIESFKTKTLIYELLD